MKSVLSRRQLFGATAVVGAIAVDSVTSQARQISGEVPWTEGAANAPTPAEPGGYQYFSSAEAQFIEAAISRLIPNDDLGPGAKEAGVAIFIDRQMAGDYGSGLHWYMQGPWAEGEKTQGFQSRMTPAQIYRAAIKAIDEHCRKAFSGKTFAQLVAQQQDDVLHGLEKGDIKLSGVKTDTFFDLLLQNTTEGFFADPLYGGNRDMVGWKLIGFPGARYDYRPYVGKHNQKLDLQPVALKGRPGWHVDES